MALRCLLLFAVSIACALTIVSAAGRCRAPGRRCAGAPGRPAVRWIPCCHGGCNVRLPGRWGKFCSGTSRRSRRRRTRGNRSTQCRRGGERCRGAPGKPSVEWKPCCNPTARCVPVSDPKDWGYRCTQEGRETSGGGRRGGRHGGKDPVEAKCHANGQKCVGAPGRPAVPWLPCCGGGTCVPDKGSWGKVCRGGRDVSPEKPPSSPTCHDTNIRCQGAPGYPFVQWKPCCKSGDKCLPAKDWGFKCQPAGSSGGTTTTAMPDSTKPNSGTTPETSTTTPVDPETGGTSRPTTDPDTSPVPSPSPTGSDTDSPSGPSTGPETSTPSQSTPTPSPGPTQGAGPCAGRRPIRKEVGDMSQGEWDNFVAAFKALVAKKGSAGMSPYESFTSAHAEGASVGHGTGYFLLWHRVMLFDFETALAAERPGVTLPYVDWSIRRGNNLAQERRIFDPDRFGAAARGPREIHSGSFVGLRNSVNVNRRLQPVRRDVGRWGPPVDRDRLDEVLKIKDFGIFSTTLEGIHGAFHMFVGGDMSNSLYSPADPFFYAHHAFIDKTYDDWLKIAGNKVKGPANLQRALIPFGQTPQQVMTGIQGCVTYQESSRRGSLARTAARQADSGGASSSGDTEDDADADFVTDSEAQRKSSSASIAPGQKLKAAKSEEPKTPVKLKDTVEKRKLQKKAAEDKVEKPEEYKAKVKEVVEQVKATESAALRFGMTAEQVKLVKETLRLCALRQGLELKEEDTSKSTDQLRKEGEEEKKAIEKGEKPAGSGDDSDVKKKVDVPPEAVGASKAPTSTVPSAPVGEERNATSPTSAVPSQTTQSGDSDELSADASPEVTPEIPSQASPTSLDSSRDAEATPGE